MSSSVTVPKNLLIPTTIGASLLFINLMLIVVAMITRMVYLQPPQVIGQPTSSSYRRPQLKDATHDSAAIAGEVVEYGQYVAVGLGLVTSMIIFGMHAQRS
jgi:hypothetical protein